MEATVPWSEEVAQTAPERSLPRSTRRTTERPGQTGVAAGVTACQSTYLDVTDVVVSPVGETWNVRVSATWGGAEDCWIRARTEYAVLVDDEDQIVDSHGPVPAIGRSPDQLVRPGSRSQSARSGIFGVPLIHRT